MKLKFFIRWTFLFGLVLSSAVSVEVSSTEQFNNEEVTVESESDDAVKESAPDEKSVEALVATSLSVQTTAVFPVGKPPVVATPEQRAAFLEAERLLAKQDDSEFLAQLQQLKDYPLYPYLQAQWLKKNLHKRAEVEQFINQYATTRYADQLRRDWLYWLAKNQQWSDFIQHYHEDDSNKIALQCYFLWAQYSVPNKDDDNQQALIAAKELWLNSKTAPAACDELFTAFMQSPLFTADVVWQRFNISLRGSKANQQLARQLKKQLPVAEQNIADFWLKVHQKPMLIMQPNWDKQHAKAGEVFAHGIDKLADNHLDNALGLWSLHKADFTISQETTDYIEQKLGLALAAQGDTAAAYASLIKVEHLTEKARQILIRLALREQNWQQIDAALGKLTAEEKEQDKWRYWQARAWMETGKAEQAKAVFTQLTKKSDFYAFLAAEKINQAYQVVDVPVQVTEQELQALQQQDAFKIVAEWQALGRNEEALRQWWYTVKKSTPKQIMAVAKLAQYWQMPKLAAFTIAKAEYWQDLGLRFPIAYLQEINQHAVKHNIDPAIVLGLIRQESVFDELAGSQVGARGLMQIMPTTGRGIARELNEPWRSAESLYEPDTNVKYGTYYYKQLLNKFNGQVALATAGYNAGPGRVKSWLPDKPMAMDIWIETIPFNETRQYVSLVLSNALFYQQRINRGVLKMTDFMTDVQPALAKTEQLSINLSTPSRSKTH